MLILGIDPGTATTGYGLVQEKENKLSYIDCGCFTTSSKNSSENRLAQLYRELKLLLKDFHPQAMAIEKIYFGKNTKTALAVGQARGIALLAATELGISVAEYTPLEVKIAITGYGRAEKSQMQKMVRQLLRLSQVPKPDDAADALAVAICHLHSYKMVNLSTRSPVKLSKQENRKTGKQENQL